MILYRSVFRLCVGGLSTLILAFCLNALGFLVLEIAGNASDEGFQTIPILLPVVLLVLSLTVANLCAILLQSPGQCAFQRGAFLAIAIAMACLANGFHQHPMLPNALGGVLTGSFFAIGLLYPVVDRTLLRHVHDPLYVLGSFIGSLTTMMTVLVLAMSV